MNRIARRAYRKAKILERKWAPVIAKVLDKQVLFFIGQLKKYGLAYGRTTELPTEGLQRALTTMFKQVAVSQANETYSELKRMNAKRKPSNIGINEVWTEDVMNYLRTNLLDKAVDPVSKRTKEIILKYIEQGLKDGLTFQDVIDEIVNDPELVTINEWRARTIVRTELTRATNYGHMLGAYDSEYEYMKTWVEVKDNRTRATHRHGVVREQRTGLIVNGVGGETVDFGEPFSNGLMYPGDPEGKAAEVINCRCVVTFALKRDRFGNPIPKQKPTQYAVSNGRVLRQYLYEIIYGAYIENMVSNVINQNMEG